MTPTDYRKERGALERQIEALIAPYLYESGYRRRAFAQDRQMLRLWVPRNLAGKLTNKTYTLLGGFVVTTFEGFTEDGVITDAEGGGLATVSWASLPLEDLFRLAAWLERMLPKLTRYEQTCQRNAAIARRSAGKAARACKPCASAGAGQCF